MSAGVAEFVALTQVSAEQAAMYLEMAGGDLETALALFFDQDGGGGAPMEDAGGAALVVEGVAVDAAAAGASIPPWWQVVWPALEAPPEAWTGQRLDSGGGEGWKGGIPQPKNGPCGVLAVVHGLILAGQDSRDPADIVLTPATTAKVIFEILWRCRPKEGSPLRLVRPQRRGCYEPGGELEITECADEGTAAEAVNARIDDFVAPGGVIDLVYSAVFTRGVDLVRQEVEEEGGELPLVPRAFNCWLCSIELMALLLRGCATGNVGAFRADGSRNGTWDGANAVGILSRKEQEQGIPMAEALKGPRCPVWILHGGDHFTVAWAKSAPPTDAGAQFTLYHWNGLPPGGPRLAELRITAVRGTVAGAEERPRFYKPEPGEVDEIVQADPADKQAHPGLYRRWRYEVLLARDREDLAGEVRGPGLPPEPKYDQEDPRYQRPGPWRCRLCYERRFQTMDFSLVPGESPDACSKCSKPRKECGWSLWVPFADLPPKRQATVMDQHAKKIEPILWTRWPAAEIVDVSGGALPDC